MDILRKFGAHARNRVCALVGIDVWLVVNSRELAVNASCVVVDVEVFINGNVAPVRNINVALGLSEGGQRILECKHELDLFEGDRLNICEWAINNLALSHRCWHLRLVVKVFLVEVIDACA